MKNSIQDKLQALFVEYAEKLPAKVSELRCEWQELRVHQADAGLLEAFHRNVHSMCGSAAIYGYELLSKEARKLEVVLKQLAEKKEVFSEQILLQIDGLLLKLEEASKQEPGRKPGESLQIIKEQKTPATKTAEHVLYVLGEENGWTNDLDKGLESAYQVRQVSSVEEVSQLVVDKETVVALIVDVDQQSDEDIVKLGELYRANAIILPIICIAEQGDLVTRLKAVRCGGKVFFQKPVEIFQIKKSLDYFSVVHESEPYRILIVDDSASLSEYYALILQEAGMVTATLNKPLEIMRSLIEFKPDLILMDVYMPGCNGLELAAVLRQQAYYTSLPIVFLSAENDKFKQVSALSIGADDFLEKPVQPQHLVAVVRSRAKRAGVLNSYMTLDGLTGLLNHTTLFQELDLELIRAKRNQTRLSFVIIDIDFFKGINDTYGHLVGDSVLRKLSEFLVTNLRRSDIIGRYGGEEFAIILPGSTAKDAEVVMNDLRERFSQLEFHSGGKTFHVAFSAGVADTTGESNSESIVAAADKALYQAKNTGRNKVVLS